MVDACLPYPVPRSYGTLTPEGNVIRNSNSVNNDPVFGSRMRTRYILAASAIFLGVCLIFSILLNKDDTVLTSETPHKVVKMIHKERMEDAAIAANFTMVNSTAATANQAILHARNTLLEAFATANRAIEWSKYAVTTANVASHTIAIAAEEGAKSALSEASKAMNSTTVIADHDISSVQDATDTDPAVVRSMVTDIKERSAKKAAALMERLNVDLNRKWLNKVSMDVNTGKKAKKENQEEDVHKARKTHEIHSGDQSKMDHEIHTEDQTKMDRNVIHAKDQTKKDRGVHGIRDTFSHGEKHEHEGEDKMKGSKKGTKKSSSSSSKYYPSSSAAINSPLISLLEDMGNGMHENVAKMTATLFNAQGIVNTAISETQETFLAAQKTANSVNMLQDAIKQAQKAASDVVHEAQETGNSASQHLVGGKEP
mmetsp:Transcript_25684/g.61876  ORF Transcript_25684/g.61876 Transcript_25684/m.61876 type:complete len:427 (+) Transcript_25684:141-1421(+)